MYNIYKSYDGKIQQISALEKDCWINFVDPDDKDTRFLTQELGIDPDFIRSSLDEEEMSRVETDDNGTTLIIVDIPAPEKEEHVGNTILFETLPLSIILHKDYIITICNDETAIGKGF